MSRFPGSSDQAPAAAAVATSRARDGGPQTAVAPDKVEPPTREVVADGQGGRSQAVEPDKLGALAHEADEPLPEVAVRDDLRLLVQSPYRLYAYWQFAREPYATLRRAFGSAADGYQLLIRLIDTASGAAQTGAASPARNYWFDAQPDHAYRAELGFAAEGKPFIHLLSSEAARTPSVSVAAAADEAPEFHVATPEFARVVNEAGYAADALTVALEAADEAHERETTLTLARTLAAAPMPALEASDLPDLRALITALVFAEPLSQVRARLSPTLARWLDALLAEHGAVDQTRLLELLRELFGFELEIDEDWHEVALRPTSWAWSASAAHQPERRVRVWLPSMSPGRAGQLPPLRPMRPTSFQPTSFGGSNVWLPSMSTRQHAPLLRWKKLVSGQ